MTPPRPSFMKRFWQALRLRLFTALTLLPIVLGAIYYGEWVFTGLVVLVGLLVIREWTAMLKAHRPQSANALLAVLIIATLGGAAMTGPQLAVIAWLAGLVLSAGFAQIGWAERPVLLGGYAYLTLPLLALVELRQMEDGAFLVLYLFALVWLTDIFAMLAGKTIGGPKLAPVISPNKTWAGLLGGMMGAAAGGAAMAHIFGWKTMSLVVFLSAGFAVIAQMGDLLESRIKRRYEVKDSGSLLPGHGGLLDRIDGLISVLAVTFLVLLGTGRMAEPAMSALLKW